MLADNDWDALAANYLGTAAMYYAGQGQRASVRGREPLLKVRDSLRFPPPTKGAFSTARLTSSRAVYADSLGLNYAQSDGHTRESDDDGTRGEPTDGPCGGDPRPRSGVLPPCGQQHHASPRRSEDQSKSAIFQLVPMRIPQRSSGTDRRPDRRRSVRRYRGLSRPPASGSDMGQAKGFVDSYKSNEFVRPRRIHDVGRKGHPRRRDEVPDWTRSAKQMEGILKKFRPEGYTVTKAAECLTCHSVDMAPKTPLAEKKYENFATLPGGVTCTLCHGLHQKWQNEHFEEPTQAGMGRPCGVRNPLPYKYSTGMHRPSQPRCEGEILRLLPRREPRGGQGCHTRDVRRRAPTAAALRAGFLHGRRAEAPWGYATQLKYFEGVKAEDTGSCSTLPHEQGSVPHPPLRGRGGHGAAVGSRVAARRSGTRHCNRRARLDFARFDRYSCHHDLKVPRVSGW